MSEERVVSVERRTAFKGYFEIGEYRFRHTLFAGGISGEVRREIFERGHATTVLPYDPVRDMVVLIRQFRPGAHVAGQHAWIWEVVAGIIDEGETTEDVARREAREEADLDILELMPMQRYLSSPGGTSETVTQYLGRVDSSTAGGIHGLATENEDILVRVFPLAEARAMLERGEIASASGLASMLWLLLNREKVRERWR
ncbi:MAG: NUDIX domain-containing protein [Reyranellaceae bacterium]